MVNNRLRVIETNPASCGKLLVDRHAVRFGQPRGGHACQFRDPEFDKMAVRVLIEGLLGRGVDTHCIDTGGRTLHLGLAEMNARLEIQKMAPEKKPLWAASEARGDGLQSS